MMGAELDDIEFFGVVWSYPAEVKKLEGERKGC